MCVEKGRGNGDCRFQYARGPAGQCLPLLPHSFLSFCVIFPRGTESEHLHPNFLILMQALREVIVTRSVTQITSITSLF